MNLLDEQLTPNRPSPNLFSSYLQTADPRCPVCAYSLRGLPSVHRCPECGFEYGLETCIWIWSNALRSPPSQHLLLGSVLILGGLVAIAARGVLDPKSWMLGVAIVPPAWVIIRWLGKRRRHFLIIDPNSLIYRVTRRVERISWLDVREAHLERELGGAVLSLTLRQGRRRIVLNHVLSDFFQVNTCEAEILRVLAQRAIECDESR